MKVFDNGELVAELPDTPKNFDGGCKRGVLTIAIGGNDVTLKAFGTHELARDTLRKLMRAYLDGQPEFYLP